MGTLLMKEDEGRSKPYKPRHVRCTSEEFATKLTTISDDLDQTAWPRRGLLSIATATSHRHPFPLPPHPPTHAISLRSAGFNLIARPLPCNNSIRTLGSCW